MGAEFLLGRPLRIEAVEDRGQLVLRDARALVLDRDQNGAAVMRGADTDFPVRRAERNRVGDHVQEYLGQATFDAWYNQTAAALGDIYDQTRRALGPGRLVHFTERAQHRADIRRRHFQAAQLGIEARCVGNIGDQPVETLDIVLD